MRTLGIYVSQIEHQHNLREQVNEQRFYRNLCERCAQAGIRAFLLTPEDIQSKQPQSTIRGWRWDEPRKMWVQQAYAIPPYIYNRMTLPPGPAAHRARELLNRLLRNSRAVLVQRPIPGKWRMHQVLRRHVRLRRYLPAGARLRNLRQLLQWLRAHSAVILKPIGGAEGRGVLLLSREADGQWSVRGRTISNEHIHRTFAASEQRACLRWLHAQIKGQKYMLQQALELQTKAGEPYDLRAFTQRSRAGEWRLRGLAARIGQVGGITANLAGGARASDARSVLAEQFAPAQVHRILRTIRTLSLTISKYTEKKFGRLCELGLDFGIDRKARIWLIEINGKPGRSIFLRSGQQQIYEDTIDGVIHHVKQL